MSLKSARMFYDVSEKARKIIESYFMLNSTLHFSYTHLVCRTAITGTYYLLTISSWGVGGTMASITTLQLVDWCSITSHCRMPL